MADGQPSNANASSDSGSPPEVSALISKHELSAKRRMEIDGNPKLKLHLKEWTEQLKEDLLKIETYRNRCIAAKAELYQLMSFYILVQGVVFGAVSNGNKLTCGTSAFPASFSFLTFVATAVSVHYKLGYCKIEKLKLINAEGFSQNLVNKINILRNAGEKFKFEDVDICQNSSERKQKNEADDQKWFYWAVGVSIFLSSLIVFVSCFVVLCVHTHKK